MPSSSTSSSLPAPWRRKHLTPAEQQVVVLVGQGLSLKETAAELGKSASTVKHQLYRAMQKVGVKNRLHLFVTLQRHALEQPAPRGTAADYAI